MLRTGGQVFIFGNTPQPLESGSCSVLATIAEGGRKWACGSEVMFTRVFVH